AEEVLGHAWMVQNRPDSRGFARQPHAIAEAPARTIQDPHSLSAPITDRGWLHVLNRRPRLSCACSVAAQLASRLKASADFEAGSGVYAMTARPGSPGSSIRL